MSNLRVIAPAPVSNEIVELLEDMLARAKRGEMKALAIAAHVHPMSTGSVFSLGTDGDIAHLVTSIERLKLRLLAYEAP